MTILLAGYEIAFRFLQPRYMPRADSIPILNAMNAQRYLYERSDVPVVIVGSSLSGRLVAEILGDDNYNLAFGGLSALDGLAVVNHARTTPRLLLIEANVLFRPASGGFLFRLFESPTARLRKTLWAMRDVARPLTVGLSYAQAVARRLLPAATQAMVAPTPNSETAGAARGESVFNRMLSLQRIAYGQEITPDERSKMLASLREAIAALEARGVHLVFFEMPTHPELCELPRQRGLRETLRSEFPKLPYVRIGDCQGVQSTDGVHLTLDEASRVTRILRDLIDSELPPPALVLRSAASSCKPAWSGHEPCTS